MRAALRQLVQGLNEPGLALHTFRGQYSIRYDNTLVQQHDNAKHTSSCSVADADPEHLEAMANEVIPNHQ